MSDGDLRRDVHRLFGTFFADKGFAETYYRYDAAAFGNEDLVLVDGHGVTLEFTRDRSFVALEIKKSAPVLRHGDARRLLARLGTDDSRYGTYEDEGMMPALAQDIMRHWDAMLALLQRGFR